MSENKKYFYLKLKDSFFSSEEMMMLENIPDGLIYQNIYLRLCLLSLKTDGALTFKNMIPYDARMLATVLHIDLAKMEFAINTFVHLGLMVKTDSETLFMSDIQSLIGKSSTEAERIAKYRSKLQGCTKSVQMLQSCTPEIEIEKEIELKKNTETKKEIEKDTDKESVCAFSEISTSQNQTKDYSSLQKDMYSLIIQHNLSVPNSKKVPVSGSEISFIQKESRELFTAIGTNEPCDRIRQALINYLKVAKSDTWRTSFTWSSFCKNFNEFVPEYFSLDKYVKHEKTYGYTVHTDEEYEVGCDNPETLSF